MKHSIDYAPTNYKEFDSIELALKMRQEEEYNPSAIVELLDRNGDDYGSYEDIADAYEAALDGTLSEALSRIGDHRFIEKYMDWAREQEDLYPVYYPMSEFDAIVQGDKPRDIASMCFYGDFRPYDDYFYFDGCGNIVSLDEWKAMKEIHENLTHDDLWDVIEIAAQYHYVEECGSSVLLARRI